VTRLNLRDAPHHIWNLDESAFFTDPRSGKVVAEIGSKTHRASAGTGRNCFTAMACVNASGVALPPLIIFEGKNMYSSWKGQRTIPKTTISVSGKL
jgi:hypothetical protein